MTDHTLTASPERRAQRVRHTLRFRRLTVLRTEHPTPHLIRITLGGPELEGFTSPGFDDHMKLFFPDPQTGALTLPTAGPDGPIWPEGPKPIARDYTPHHHDPAAGTLQVDFALHEAGPATAWARQARPGDLLGVGGPRGSFIVPTNFDWHLLIGDDTALPAIARRLAELPADARVLVLAEVDSAADQVPLPTAARAQVVWVHRDSSPAEGEFPLLAALRGTPLPTGAFHAWIGCESAAAKALRAHLVHDCQANPQWIRASGYWRRGAAGTHDSHGD
ncbi:siderophore-interacting protein [Xenophilus sp. Marseille-Q4582]|uniref:siderophore-interacting protein n=1 Tax=Xenophilus sp. Marseille-Q4582 TaxID=2866600 RepID=UPI001CE3D36A|nr:siderophore-interacting protein [Xenophilus sp. Marseille-Q4582]